jgi:hypothetical protein
LIDRLTAWTPSSGSSHHRSDGAASRRSTRQSGVTTTGSGAERHFWRGAGPRRPLVRLRSRRAHNPRRLPWPQWSATSPPRVTSLTAKAVSFFSPSLVGCKKGQSSPEDVAGGVFLGVGLVPTADASEHRLCNAVLPGCVVAGFAAVGGVPGVHVDHLRQSFFRFGRRIEANCVELASEMLSFNPVLAAAPVARKAPGISGSRRGLARRTMVAIFGPL